MGKLVFGMNLSLDGYVDDVEGTIQLPPAGPALFRYWTDHVRSVAGMLYGRRIYDVMCYWDEDHPEWDTAQHAFAAAWRARPIAQIARL
jgi:hypothetical protein